MGRYFLKLKIYLPVLGICLLKMVQIFLKVKLLLQNMGEHIQR